MTRRPFVLLAALAVLPYGPGLFHDFVYDDHGALVENQFFAEPNAWSRVLTLDTFRDARVLDGTRPTLLLSVLVDRALGAREAWHFRIANWLLHAGCVLLFFVWLRGVLTRMRHAAPSAAAFVAALVVAAHPLASEAVQVPSYREDVLALFWMLVALSLMPVRRPWIRIPLQLASFLLALGAKESAMVGPAWVAAVWWIFPAERPPRVRAAIELTCAVSLVAGYLWLALSARPPQALAGPWNGLSLRWPDNVRAAPLLFLQYLKLLVAPWPLCADRFFAPNLSPVVAVLLAIALGAMLGLGILRGRRRAPLVALGLGWLLIAFVPISNLVPLHNPFADRYAYAMIPGLAVPAAALPLTDRAVRRGLIAVAAAYVLLLQLRLPDWRNDAALWSATLRVEPRSARAHTGLALIALQQGALETAERYFARADQLNPRDVTALVNLAVLDGRRNDVAAAAEKLEEAVRRRPDKAEAWANLAIAWELLGRRDEALNAAEKARALDPLRRF